MARLRSGISSVPVALVGWAMCAAALFAQTAAPTAFPPAPEGFDARRPGIPTGRVERIEYASTVTGGKRPAMVYTPPGYSPARKYPVLYLLHGIGGNETHWTQFGAADSILDNLIAANKAVPMIVVMPNGRASNEPSTMFGGRGGPSSGPRGDPGDGAGAALGAARDGSARGRGQAAAAEPAQADQAPLGWASSFRPTRLSSAN